MPEPSDIDLLRDYAVHASQVAFQKLVQRHTDFVYASALRQLGASDLAGDVAQSVFIDLARKAGSLSKQLTKDAMLVGWLHRSTRFTVLNLLRRERRRWIREKQAMGEFEMTREPASDWERLRPVLDEAMAGLNEEDRTALLLRFFKNQDLRSVGDAFGVSDDVAQKRVSRALEKLRVLLARQGITTSAAALATIFATHSVQGAPAGLSAAISNAATTVLANHAAGLTTGGKLLAMTTVQKIIITGSIVGVVLAAGTGLYERQRASQLETQLQEERSNAQKRLQHLEHENAELPRLRNRISQLQNAFQEKLASPGSETQPPPNSAELALQAWLSRVKDLKQQLEKMPEAQIPEMQYLREDDWLDVTRITAPYHNQREAFSALRMNAEHKALQEVLQPALQAYLKTNNGQSPTDVVQLVPYLRSPVDSAVLQRYEIVPEASVPNLRGGESWVITQKSLVDPEYDTRLVFGPGSSGAVSGVETLYPVWKAFALANQGQPSTDPAQLLPYATTPAQQAEVQKLIRQHSLLTK